MIKFCPLCSGSSGNSVLVSANGTNILIDAGVSARRIEAALASIDENTSSVDAIFVSHEHIDHIRGIGVLSRKFDIPVYANEATWHCLKKSVNSAGNIQEKNIRYFTNEKPVEINGLTVLPFNTPHDAAESSGFNIFVSGVKLTVATDLGHINKRLLGYLEGSDLLMLESNHDIEMLKAGPYPYYLKKRILSDTGHLSNEMAGKVIAYLASRGTKSFVLGHLSKENNIPELAAGTVCRELETRGIKPGRDITLSVAARMTASSIQYQGRF